MVGFKSPQALHIIDNESKVIKHKIKATVYDKKGRVLSQGVNSYSKTHPQQSELANKCNLQHKIFLHAEIAALVKVKSGTPHKIKIERYNKTGEPMLAKPCPICELAIKEAGISVVEYTL